MPVKNIKHVVARLATRFLTFLFGTMSQSLYADVAPKYSYFGMTVNSTNLSELFPTSSISENYVHVSDRDSKGGVYHFSVRTDSPVMRTVHLSFEKPDRMFLDKNLSWKRNHVLRHPKCSEILKTLLATYGRFDSTAEDWEEALLNRSRTWKSGDESMTLFCYRVNGRGVELAQRLQFQKIAK